MKPQFDVNSFGESSCSSNDSDDSIPSSYSDGLAMLARVSANMLLQDDEDSQQNSKDTLSANESFSKPFLSRDLERHRILEKERRFRIRRVYDDLLNKLPEKLWKNKCPNKTKPSQIDTLEIAIKYIEDLEKMVYRTETVTDEDKDKRLYESGYLKCVDDLQFYAKREQILCGDSRRLMQFLQCKAVKELYSKHRDAANASEAEILPSLSSHSSNSSYKHGVKRHREFEKKNDSLTCSIFKRSKNDNNDGIPNVRFSKRNFLNRYNGQSILLANNDSSTVEESIEPDEKL